MNGSTYGIKLDLDLSKFNSKMKTAQKSMDSLSKNMSKAGTIKTTGISKAMDSISKSANKMKNTMGSATKSITSGFSLIKASIIGAGIIKGFQMITAEMGNAIKRVDTMNNFTKVMSNFGIGTQEAEKSINRLSDKLIGLPTTLDSAVLSVQRFTSANKNLGASTEMFLAVNNAILAGGANMGLQQSALEQLTQAYSKGKFDIMEWRTLQMAMPAQLNQIATAMGYVSDSDLYEALKAGKVSMNDFMKTVVDMNKNGAKGIKSFEEQAVNATGGIETSMTNMKTAITRGLADIMNAIGQSNIAGFFQGITRAINAVIPYITAFVKVVKEAIAYVSALFGNKVKSNTEKTAKATDGLASSAGGASENLDKEADSAKKLNKALKTANFDELQNLNNNSGGGGSGATPSGDVGALDIDMSGFDADLDKSASKVDIIAEKMKNAFSWLTQGVNFDEIFNSLAVTLTNIKTMVDQIGYSFVQVFINEGMAQEIVGIWGEKLNNIIQIVGNIAQRFTEAWTNNDAGTTLVRTFTEAYMAWEKLTNTILTDINEISQGGLFTDIFTNVILFFTNVGEIAGGLFDALNKAWAEGENGKQIMEAIGGVFNDILKFANSIADTIKKWVLSPEFQNVLNIVFGIIKDIANAIKEVADWVVDMWDKYVKPVLDEKIMPLLSDLADLIKAIWDKFLKPLVDNVVTVLKPILEAVIKSLGQWLGNMIDVLRGIIQFLTSVFTGDWKKAFEGIRTFTTGILNNMISGFANAFNLIWSVVKGILNMIIMGLENMVNFGIRALNRLIGPLAKVGNTVLKAVGIKGFTFNTISEVRLPRLNVGTDMVKQEGLAYLHAGEKVVPADVVKGGYTGDNGETNELLRQLIDAVNEKDYNPYITVDDIGRASVNYINKKQRITGEAIV